MVDQYVGEIKLVGFNFAPTGWAQCAGQIIAISQNSALFALLGTMYGGNGTSNFGLPDLRGRAGGHVGPNLYTNQGLQMGTTGVTINMTEYPAHSHAFNVNATAGTTATPGTADYLATDMSGTAAGPNLYVPGQGASLQPLYNGTPNPVLGFAQGGSQPHENMQPYLAMTYCIALQGVFPPRG